MKILILGARGNLGYQLEKVFQKDSDYEVISWDKNDVDISNQKNIEKAIGDLKPDIIINAAAYNAVDKCEESEEEFRKAQKINGQAVGFLADAAIKNNCLLVHYSTDYVFKGEKEGGYSEDDLPEPINNYGRSKLAGEKEILSRADQDLKYYLIRVSKLFGPRGKSEAAKENFFDIMIKLSGEKKELDVVDEEESLFTYTPDLAKATKELIEEKYPYGIYHLPGGGEGATWHEATEILFKILDKDIKIKPVSADKFPRPAKRPAHSVLLNKKFRQLRSWPEALEEYLNLKN